MIILLIKKFNLLCTGLQRQERKTVKSEPLYNYSIKGLLIKSLSLKTQQQNAFIKKGINKYERELKKNIILINNRKIAQQLFLILCNVIDQEQDLNIFENIEVQNQLKTELITMIDKKEFFNFEIGAKEFDRRFIINKVKVVPTITNLENIFDTDLKNSVFNQVSIEEANCRGETFFKEFLQFHDSDETNEKITSIRKPIDRFEFPELNF